jgi:streptogramin lyase
MKARLASLAVLAVLVPLETGADQIPGFTTTLAPSYPGYARGMTAGSDGSLWLTDAGRNEIGRVSGLGGTPNPDFTVGTYTGFPLPTANAFPEPITAGRDGNLWFVEKNNGGKIGRCTTAGVITEFPLPGPSGSAWAIAAGLDGNLWLSNSRFDAAHLARLLKVTPAGDATAYPLAAGFGVGALTAGADGNVWFIESNATMGGIGRITPDGMITDFWLAAGHVPAQLTLGPDGNIWFTESAANAIGRITPSGVITEFEVSTAGTWPTAISSGIDGNIWFHGLDSRKIYQLVVSTATDQGQATFNESGIFSFFQVTQLLPLPAPNGAANAVAIGVRGQSLQRAAAHETPCPVPAFIVRDSSSGTHNSRACAAAAPPACADLWVGGWAALAPRNGGDAWLGSFESVVRNYGPHAAVHVRLEARVKDLDAYISALSVGKVYYNADPTAMLSRPYPDPPPLCEFMSREVTCLVPDMEVGEAFRLVAGIRSTRIGFTASQIVHAPTPDPWPINNIAVRRGSATPLPNLVLTPDFNDLVIIPVRGSPH